jgi:hypothetical protein
VKNGKTNQFLTEGTPIAAEQDFYTFEKLVS